jgi:CRP-like cAMP-binding protein
MISSAANAQQLDATDDAALYGASLSSALVTIFRGNFCDVILPGRSSVIFKRDEVLYDVGAKDRIVFFIRSGFIKVGTVTQDAREIIYDVRKAGEVVGELCTCRPVRSDRAVALEPSDAIPVPYFEIVAALQKSPELLGKFIEVFCDCLADAYDQINTLAVHDIARRLTRVLLSLASKIGQRSGYRVEIPTYLTQEEISQIVVARRERVSTALNLLRRHGMVQYSHQGHLLLDVKALESHTL